MAYDTVKSSSSDPLADQASKSYVDWGAIIGGIFLATAISVVLLAFGSAIGLSFSAASVSGKTFVVGAGIGAAIWFIWVQVSSFMAGAYLTGRLRKRKGDATEHEVEVRDGSHGLLVWAGCVILGSYLALSGAASVVNSIGSIAKTATEAASNVPKTTPTGAMQYYTDVLLRSPATTAAAPSPADRTQLSSEINTILSKTAIAPLNTAPNADDKAYLSQVVAQQTGVPADVANTRVTEAYANIESAKAEVAKAADSARRVAIIAAFLLAASLLVSAAAAYWAATIGGHHRDNAVEFTGFFRRL
ncbi:MAG: hypothetical protein ABIN69_11860 [Aestuariivirga sp.]